VEHHRFGAGDYRGDDFRLRGAYLTAYDSKYRRTVRFYSCGGLRRSLARGRN